MQELVAHRCIHLLGFALAAVGCQSESPHVPMGATVGSAQVVGQTETVCPWLGPSVGRPGIYGTDLGIAVKAPNPTGEADHLLMLFGDTWTEATTACTYPVTPSDDLQVTVPAERPSVLDDPQQAASACQMLQYPVDDGSDPTSWRRMRLYRNAGDRSEANLLDTSANRTPVAAFSDGLHLFGVFVRDEPAACNTSADCPARMLCSSDPGYTGKTIKACSLQVSVTSDAAPAFCLKGGDCSAVSSCDALDQGVCLAAAPFSAQRADQTLSPSWYTDDPRRGIALTMRVASAFWPDRPEDYATGFRFITNKFINVTARTVNHFDPEHPEQNDYSPGTETLLLWGRTTFVTSNGWQAPLFLLYQPLADLMDEAGTIRWSPRFFAGYDPEGNPTWSDNEADAEPVYGVDENLVQTATGWRWQWQQPEFDYVNQMSITWFAPLSRWVMVYGGDTPLVNLADPISGVSPNATFPQSIPGSIYVRSAAHPWGRSTANADSAEAWSTARPLLTRHAVAKYLACDDDAKSTADCNDAPDERHPSDLASTIAGIALATEVSKDNWLAVTAKCIAGDAALASQSAAAEDSGGHLYGSNVIEEWTRDVSAQTPGLLPAEAAVEFYWNVSTWNPYQVLLLKSVLRTSDLL